MKVKLGRSFEEVLINYEALTEQAVACLKNDTGYQLVSPPRGANKKFQARTSGRPSGQRHLGSFSSAEEAAKEVYLWIIGIVDTPPTPGRLKDRRKRNEGKRQRDRCSYGTGALLPSLFPLVSRAPWLPFPRRWRGHAHQRVPTEEAGTEGARVDRADRLAARHRVAFGRAARHDDFELRAGAGAACACRHRRRSGCGGHTSV